MLFRDYFKEPMLATEHHDITGNIQMSNQLREFSALALDNYKDSVAKLNKQQPVELNIVFVTNDEMLEYNKVENQTIPQITANIFKMIDELENKSFYL